MSQHRSLKTSRAGTKQRSVLKRYERMTALKEKGILKEEDSVFGMPKLKVVRVKIKKEKAEEKPEETQGAEGASLPSTEAQKEKGKKEEKKEKK